MRRGGSQAYRLDAYEYQVEQTPSREFVAVEGGRLDAKARMGVRPLFAKLVMSAVLVGVLSFGLGGLAVFLTSGTVSLLQQNNALSSQIKDERALNGEMRIERSLLTRSERITQIATQNLGMVYANTADRLDLN
ncbi:MAG: hypothetical protein Q4A01_06990 [Coriobacteriales bacterium]|nr:hypothetical protein [Coriobacteriales bacterium]